tara:strand:+ start:2958 stop:5945 length:2988 start_codon:yes stop_codon:yes gene_type:complete
MRKLQYALLLTILMLTPVFGQWSTAAVRGGKTTIGAAHDSVFFAAQAYMDLPDTILTTSSGASGTHIIVGDLNDPETMWDMVAGRTAELNGSFWRTEQKLLPQRWLWTVSDGGDSIICWNRDDMTRVIHFDKEANGVFGDNAPTDILFLDNILYITTGAGMAVVDFQMDKMFFYDTAGKYVWKGDGITTRNAAGGYDAAFNSATTMEINNNVIHAVDAIRDPFQMPMRDGSGRTAQYWMVGTDGGSNLYNPWVNGIFRGNMPDESADWLAMTSKGGVFTLRDYVSQDMIIYRMTVLDSDSTFAMNSWVNGGEFYASRTGSEDLYQASEVQKHAVVFEGASAAGNNGDVLVVASDEQLHVIHTHPKSSSVRPQRNGAKLRLNALLHAPYGKGDLHGAWPLHSIYDESADREKHFTNNNTVTFVKGGPGGIYANFVAASSQSLSQVDHADWGGMAEITFSAWFYRDVDSGGEEYILSKWDQGTAGDRSFRIVIDAGDNIGIYIQNASDGAAGVTGPDVSLATWYHVVGTYDGANVAMYLNGVFIGSDTITGNIDDSGEVLFIGSGSSGDTAEDFFDGRITHATVSTSVWSHKEAGGVYSDGLKMMNIAGFENGTLACPSCVPGGTTGIDYMNGDDGYLVTGDDDSLQVFVMGATTLIPQFRVKSANGAIKDAVVWVEPGADSVSYAYVTPTRLVVVQRDPNLLSAAAHRWTYEDPKAVINGWVVVDSSGQEGVFWSVRMAIQAGEIAGQNKIQVRAGTYNEWGSTEIRARNTILEGAGSGGNGTFGGITPAPGPLARQANLLRKNTGPRITLIQSNDDWGKDVIAVGDAAGSVNNSGIGTTLRNFAVRTTSSGAAGRAMRVHQHSQHVTIDNVAFLDSDGSLGAVNWLSANSTPGGTIKNSWFHGGDAYGIYAGNHGIRILNNWFGDDWADYPIYIGDAGDESIIMGNVIDDASSSINIGASGNNGIVCGNVMDVAMSVTGTGWSTCGGDGVGNEVY